MRFSVRRRSARTASCVLSSLLLANVVPALAGPHARPKLTERSTLADWKTAGPEARSEVAVAIARKRLPAEATKLEVAKAAMEITGCLTSTARDARFDSWLVAPTAATCLEAPERPAPAAPPATQASPGKDPLRPD